MFFSITFSYSNKEGENDVCSLCTNVLTSEHLRYPKRQHRVSITDGKMSVSALLQSGRSTIQCVDEACPIHFRHWEMGSTDNERIY